MTGFMKISEAAQKWDISERRVNTLCLQGRIKNAIKFGNTWAIPEDTEKPNDLRIKTGKYLKKNRVEVELQHGKNHKCTD